MTSFFDNSFLRLSEDFYYEIKPEKMPSPEIIKINQSLAEKLNFNEKYLNKDYLSGNKLISGSKQFAQKYAGHQFGNFVPNLGDGRAIMLGEIIDNQKKRQDIQLKGSGKTPFSRMGDGRAGLGPVLREYLVSESMHYLGIPSTRSLAILLTGEKIIRENVQPGALLVRVASSHIRIGTFEYFAYKNDVKNIKKLADYCIERHYPKINKKNKYLNFLQSVTERQALLISKWMGVGFVHGVMNTDNSTISGETIDYGPCAFMDHYDANTVFSSIDTQGRYSFANQPSIIQWNLVRLAECLLPLIDKNEKKSIEIAQNLLNTFSSLFKDRWLQMMRKKLGIKDQSEDDEELINNLIKWMQQKKPDFTNTFCNLMNYDHAGDKEFEDDEFNNWKREWEERIKNKEYLDVMMSCNPILIPRNYLVEEALSEAEIDGKLDKFNELNEIISSPYQLKKVNTKYLKTPIKSNIPYKTFCGT